MATQITRKINLLLLKNIKGLFLKAFLNEDEPHLEQTILPPNDRSETKEELPQLRQILFTLIT